MQLVSVTALLDKFKSLEHPNNKIGLTLSRANICWMSRGLEDSVLPNREEDSILHDERKWLNTSATNTKINFYFQSAKLSSEYEINYPLSFFLGLLLMWNFIFRAFSTRRLRIWTRNLETRKKNRRLDFTSSKNVRTEKSP